jgi:hypothetical protein
MTLKIALLAPDLSGHRGHWLREILEKARVHGTEVFVYTIERKYSGEYLGSLGLRSENSVFEDCAETLIDKWLSDVGKDQIMGMSWEADRILHKFLFVRGRYRLLIMRPYLESADIPGITRFLVKRFLASVLTSRRTIEVARLSIPYAHKNAKKNHWVRDDFNTEVFLNSISNFEIPNELVSIPEHHHIVSVLGYLDLRKNPVQAYRLVEELRRKNRRNILLVFAGQQSEAFRIELLKIKQLQGVIQIDRELTDNEFKGVIKASKVILLIYSNLGPSGIVLNSLTLGTPVLLKGGRNWRNLQKNTGGIFRAEKGNPDRLKKQLEEQLRLPRQSKVKILCEEPIPSVGDFILGRSSRFA